MSRTCSASSRFDIPPAWRDFFGSACPAAPARRDLATRKLHWSVHTIRPCLDQCCHATRSAVDKHLRPGGPVSRIGRSETSFPAAFRRVSASSAASFFAKARSSRTASAHGASRWSDRFSVRAPQYCLYGAARGLNQAVDEQPPRFERRAACGRRPGNKSLSK